MAAGRARGSRPRRVSLPGVAELLRPVGPGPASDSGRQASGREAHPQKITVYLSADELLDLERARLTLLAHGIGVDRGRLVREAIAVLMMDLETGIDASVIARRLGAPGRPVPADPVPVPASEGLANGAHGALTGGTLDDCGPVTGTMAYGVPADGGPVTDVLVDGDLVTGELANGGLVDGVLVDGNLVTDGLAHGVPADGGPVAGALGDDGLVAGAPAVAQ